LVVKTSGTNQGLIINSLSLYQESNAILLGTVTADSINNTKAQPFYVTADGTVYCKNIITQTPISSSLLTLTGGSIYDATTGLTTNPNGSVYDYQNLLVSAQPNAVSNIIDISSNQTIYNKTIDSSCVLGNANIAYKNIQNIFLGYQNFQNIVIQSGSLQIAPSGTIQLPNGSQTINNTTTLIDTNSTQTLTNKTISTGCAFDISVQTPAISLSSSSVSLYIPGINEIGYRINGTITADQSITLTSGGLATFASLYLPLGTWLLQGTISVICTTSGTLNGNCGCSIVINTTSLSPGNSQILLQNGNINASSSLADSICINYSFVRQNGTARNLYLIGFYTFSNGTVLKNSASYTSFSATRIA
jgi:hypothetical protein